MTTDLTSTDKVATSADRPLRSFGRRKGHALSVRQAQLVADLLPRLRLDPAGPVPDPATLFGRPVTDVWLEIGFGGGEHLIGQAEANPGVGLIGCEPYLNGVASLLGEIDRRGLDTVRLHDGDARDLLAWLPEAMLDRVFILFPDPWPKKRQKKRRLIQPDMLRDLARTLRPRAELRFASDDPDYVEATEAAARACGAFALESRAATRPADWPETRYERKAKEAGRTCAYLVFRRVASGTIRETSRPGD